jgi:hypothetical protein
MLRQTDYGPWQPSFRRHDERLNSQPSNSATSQNVERTFRATKRAILLRRARCERPRMERYFTAGGNSLRKQYLHLSAYACDLCAGPVIAGATAIRENEISKETNIRQVGALCLSCGHRQSVEGEAPVRHLLPIEWNPVSASGGHVKRASA